MKTNFFEAIAELKVNGNLLLNIHRNDQDYLTVSVALSNEVRLPPLLFEGMPHELDEGFFEALNAPVQETKGLLTNLSNYRKELDKAKKNGKDKTPAKPAASAASDNDAEEEEQENNLFTPKPDAKQAKAERKRLYEEQMQKVKTLAQQMKYAEALVQLPDPDEHAEQAQLIASKRKEIEAAKKIYDQLQEGFTD